VTFEQIDAEARIIAFLEVGLSDLDWGVVDETVRNYYRVKAERKLTALNEDV
jgi:hypothetical protein